MRFHEKGERAGRRKRTIKDFDPDNRFLGDKLKPENKFHLKHKRVEPSKEHIKRELSLANKNAIIKKKDFRFKMVELG